MIVAVVEKGVVWIGISAWRGEESRGLWGLGIEDEGKGECWGRGEDRRMPDIPKLKSSEEDNRGAGGIVCVRFKNEVSWPNFHQVNNESETFCNKIDNHITSHHIVMHPRKIGHMWECHCRFVFSIAFGNRVCMYGTFERSPDVLLVGYHMLEYVGTGVRGRAYAR